MFDPEKLAHKLQELGEAWADTDAAFHAFDDATKSVLSEAGEKLNKPELSMNAREAEARRSPMFMEHLQALGEARREKNFALVKYETFKVYVELLRSREATNRAEMNLR